MIYYQMLFLTAQLLRYKVNIQAHIHTRFCVVSKQTLLGLSYRQSVPLQIQTFEMIYWKEAVLIYSEIDFQIEVSENINEFPNNSALGLYVLRWTMDGDLKRLEWTSAVL